MNGNGGGRDFIIFLILTFIAWGFLHTYSGMYSVMEQKYKSCVASLPKSTFECFYDNECPKCATQNNYYTSECVDNYCVLCNTLNRTFVLT